MSLPVNIMHVLSATGIDIRAKKNIITDDVQRDMLRCCMIESGKLCKRACVDSIHAAQCSVSDIITVKGAGVTSATDSNNSNFVGN